MKSKRPHHKQSEKQKLKHPVSKDLKPAKEIIETDPIH